MLWLLYLSAILAVVAQGEDDCPLYKYFTLNTLLPVKSLSFSCYGLESSCNVYYTPPDSGCKTNSLTLLGNVLQNETKVLTSNDVFEIGSGFCSDNQIGVSSVDVVTANVENHLPRATEAGTNFYVTLVMVNEIIHHECRFYALTEPAQVTINDNGAVESMFIDAYSSGKHIIFNPGATLPLTLVLRIDSDNPIILSCFSDIAPIEPVTFEPISSKPLLVSVASGKNLVTVVLSDCSTNELITDLTKFSLLSVTENRGPCLIRSERQLASDIEVFSVMNDCLVYVEPLDDVCVTVTVQDLTTKVSVGIPESKFSTRFANYPALKNANVLSFAETTCTGFLNGSGESNFVLNWAGRDLLDTVAFGVLADTFTHYSWIECVDPVLIVSSEDVYRHAFLSGYQSEELWEPFFESECSGNPVEPPSESPVDPPSESPVDPPSVSPVDPPSVSPVDPPSVSPVGPPSVSPVGPPSVSPNETPSKAPSSSGAGPVFSSWAVFFGFNIFIFSVSLL